MIFRYVIAILLFVTPAWAQKTKTELNTEIATSFPNNSSGSITPTVLRKVVSDMVNSIMPTAPVVSGNLACFNGATGLLQDCGTAPVSNIGPSTVLGSVSGGAPVALSQAQLTTLVNPFTTSSKGAVPAPGSVSGKVLSDNGTWVAAGLVSSFNGRIGAVVPTSADYNSTLINTTSASTGAVQRTQLSKNSDITSVKDFGAVGNGSADDTAALQACHNTGRVCYYPSGAYNFSTLTIAAGGIKGDGIGQTILTTTDVGTANAITYTGSSGFGATTGTPTFEHFFLQGISLSKPSGAGLYFNATSGEVSYAYINDVYILNMPTSIEFVKGSSFTIMSTRFQNYWIAGLTVANVGNEDSGDSSVTNSTFNTGTLSGDGILYKSSGGLKVTNSKFNGGNYGVALVYNGPKATGDLLLSNNSIENALVAGIAIGTPTSHSFTNIVINGNQIAITPMGIQVIGGNLIGNITMNNNVIGFGGTVAGIVLDGVDRFNVSANTINGAGSGIGVVYGTANCTNGNISNNMISGVASNTTGATGSVRVVNN